MTLFLLVEGVVELEDLGADELVVTVDDVGDLVVVAVLVDGVVDVLHRRPVHVVPEEDELVPGDAAPLEVAGDVLEGHVGREVVDDDHAVVAVVLLQQRLDVPGVPVVGRVLEGGGHHAGVDLLLVPRYVVLLLVVGLFLLIKSLQFGYIFEILSNIKLSP